jgi:hypothetical protein
MLVTVHWSAVRPSLKDQQWGKTRCLYAYVAPDKRELLYIGKADGKTVRDRWLRSAKEEFWEELEKQRGIRQHAVIVGDVKIENGRRLSRELLADIESLLITRLKPWGNIQSMKSRISRPGLRVRCEGAWPHERRAFADRG